MWPIKTMRVKLQCWGKDSGVNHKTGDPYHCALFLDIDPGDKLACILKFNEDEATINRLEVGKNYAFSLKGLSPAKGDKSSLYIRGSLINESVAAAK